MGDRFTGTCRINYRSFTPAVQSLVSGRYTVIIGAVSDLLSSQKLLVLVAKSLGFKTQPIAAQLKLMKTIMPDLKVGVVYTSSVILLLQNIENLNSSQKNKV